MSKAKRREQQKRRAEFVASFVSAMQEESLRKSLRRGIADSAAGRVSEADFRKYAADESA